MLESSDLHERDTRLQIANLKTKLESGQATIRNVCQDIRNQIDLKNEQLICSVEKQRQRLHDQVGMYEKASTQDLDRSEKYFREEFDSKISQIESRLNELKSSTNAELVLNSIRDTLDDLNKRMDELIFNQKRISFIENENNQVATETLGFLDYSTPYQQSDAKPTTIDLSATFTRLGMPRGQTQIEILDNGNYVFSFVSQGSYQSILKWYMTNGNFELIDSSYFSINEDTPYILRKFGNISIVAYLCRNVTSSNLYNIELHIFPAKRYTFYTRMSKFKDIEACEQGFFVLHESGSASFYAWNGYSEEHAILAHFRNGAGFRAENKRFYFAYNTTQTLKVFDKNGELLQCIANPYGTCFQVLPTSNSLLFFDEKKLVFVYVNMRGEKMREFTLDSFKDILHQPRIIVTASDDVYIYDNETQIATCSPQADQNPNLEISLGCKLLKLPSS